MIVYHGSNSNFKQLRISKSLVKHNSTSLNEGLGIYFSLDKKVASSYGKYLYTLELNDNFVLDFRKKQMCRAYVNKLRQYIMSNTKVDIGRYINLNLLVDSLYYGKVAICGTGRETYLLLDSTEEWYELPEEKMDKIYKILKTYDKKNLVAYTFNYNIKGVGIIKRIDDNIIRIIGKEKLN